MNGQPNGARDNGPLTFFSCVRFGPWVGFGPLAAGFTRHPTRPALTGAGAAAAAAPQAGHGRSVGTRRRHARGPRGSKKARPVATNPCQGKGFLSHMFGRDVRVDSTAPKHHLPRCVMVMVWPLRSLGSRESNQPKHLVGNEHGPQTLSYTMTASPQNTEQSRGKGHTNGTEHQKATRARARPRHEEKKDARVLRNARPAALPSW